MTQREKARFIRELCNRVRDDLAAKVNRMPESWDGHELRELIADTFREQRGDKLRKGTKGHRDYQNDVIVLGL